MTRSEDRKVARWALAAIPLFLFPSVCLLLALPLGWVVWSGLLAGEGGLAGAHPMFLAFVAAVTVAVLAVPGYFVAAFDEERLADMRGSGRWWIRSSLGGAIFASMVAAPLTFFFGRWLWIFPAGTLGACLFLIARSERLWRRRDQRPEPEGSAPSQG